MSKHPKKSKPKATRVAEPAPLTTLELRKAIVQLEFLLEDLPKYSTEALRSLLTEMASTLAHGQLVGLLMMAFTESMRQAERQLEERGDSKLGVEP